MNIKITCLIIFLSIVLANQPGYSQKNNSVRNVSENGYLAGKGNNDYERSPEVKKIPSVALKEMHKGMTFGFLAKNGYFSSSEALAQIDKMASLGITWVSLVTIIMQENPWSTRIYKDFEYTASDAELEMIIDRFHQKGIRVMLYPCLEMHDSNWRGLINFPQGHQQIQGITTDYWTPWFRSYTNAMVNYGRLAQRKGVEMLCLGAEMNGTVYQNEHWSKLIDEVRQIYTGPLIYEVHGNINFENLPTWYKKLDMIGFSFYGSVGEKLGATNEEMIKFTQSRVQHMKKFPDLVGKPLIFTEGGALSRKNATTNPDSWSKPGEYDGEEQAKWMDIVFTAFWNEPWWRGLYWWKWDEHQYRPQYYTDPKGSQDFTIQGKPAEKTLKKWYSRKDR